MCIGFCLNKFDVLNWQLTPEEIEKYKTPVRLIEKNR